ncbi:MAG TPA: ethanolamine ammonia-lyase reactivating factor EutA [Burkholderiales bacterium]
MKRRHTVDDHALGREHGHSHDGADADHDHEHFDESLPLEENPIWIQDHVSLASVGIDIGSSGTQVIFSRVELRRFGEALTSRYRVVKRETLHASPIALTPYAADDRIDAARLGDIIDAAYAAARVTPDGIDTGVVILTGEALRRENAAAIAEVIARRGGDLVCASAGHHMEAQLAAYGSGAAKVSTDQAKRILNVDIGGGTTKLALIDRGRIVATAALHIGGRLQAMDAKGRIVRLEPGGARHAKATGFDWKRGDVPEGAGLDRVAESMADSLLKFDSFYLTEPIALENIDGVMFSGGVAEYVYGRESRDFGDLGRRLGHALKKRIDSGALPWPLLPPGECIRATALGASEYSVQLSGNTCYISDPGTLLPRRNLQVLHPDIDLSGNISSGAIEKAIRSHFTAFDLIEGEAEVALAFRWSGAPAYERIAALAAGLCLALRASLAKALPLYVVLDGDIAQTLGAILREERGVKNPLLVIDGIDLRDFDYIDLGRVRLPSRTVPVTVKSLLFNQDPRT